MILNENNKKQKTNSQSLGFLYQNIDTIFVFDFIAQVIFSIGFS